jgi:hypothetical protein
MPRSVTATVSQGRWLAASERHLPIALLIGGHAPRHVTHRAVVFRHLH